MNPEYVANYTKKTSRRSREAVAGATDTALAAALNEDRSAPASRAGEMLFLFFILLHLFSPPFVIIYIFITVNIFSLLYCHRRSSFAPALELGPVVPADPGKRDAVALQIERRDL